jgi:hypothetical protein
VTTTFEDYLRATFSNINWIDHSIRCTVHPDRVEFYVHPMSRGGATCNFTVRGNELTTDQVSFPDDWKPAAEDK